MGWAVRVALGTEWGSHGDGCHEEIWGLSPGSLLKLIWAASFLLMSTFPSKETWSFHNELPQN